VKKVTLRCLALEGLSYPVLSRPKLLHPKVLLLRKPLRPTLPTDSGMPL
jgi:hypothetical protein